MTEASDLIIYPPFCMRITEITQNALFTRQAVVIKHNSWPTLQELQETSSKTPMLRTTSLPEALYIKKPHHFRKKLCSIQSIAMTTTGPPNGNSETNKQTNTTHVMLQNVPLYYSAFYSQTFFPKFCTWLPQSIVHAEAP